MSQEQVDLDNGINWLELNALAKEVATPGHSPGKLSAVKWETIDESLTRLIENQDWEGVIRLRDVFNDLYARDTVGGLQVLHRLDAEAIAASRRVGAVQMLAHLLGAKGHNLHRQGYHQAAIVSFEESAALYAAQNESFESLKNHFMTALCLRALNKRELAKKVLHNVLEEVDQNNPWRGNPLHVMAWLLQDDGRVAEAENLILEAINFQRQTEDPDILLAGALADLAEVIGLQGRVEEAIGHFQHSLAIIQKHEGQYDRQEARTTLKYAELFMRQKEYLTAMHFLDQADDKIRGYGHYHDLMWRIELTRAYIYWQQRDLINTFRKFRIVRYFRKELGLSNFLLIRQLISRLRAKTGLPR